MSPCAPSPSRNNAKIIGEHAAVVAAPPVTPVDSAGEILRRRDIGPFALSELLYPAEAKLVRHVHAETYITFVIDGSFREQYESGALVCRPGAVRFLPAGEWHANEIESGMRCLQVSAGAEVFDQLARQAQVPKKPAQITGLMATWLANRLYAEFTREDTASSIAIEGLVLAILAEIARVDTKPNVSVPDWLRQATEIVESRFLERLSLAEIAQKVGVHYVHLSRQFHKYNHCTIGELIRRRRVQYASHLLAHSQTPLAEIALICGFSDQSHLSFLFKRYMGMSPSKFRTLAGRDAGPRTLDDVRGINGGAGVDAPALRASGK